MHIPGSLSRLFGASPRCADLKAFETLPPGVQAIPVGDVLAQREIGELLGRIERCFGFREAEFARRVRPVIEAYARFVHLLPASESYHHSATAGLLIHGLEVGFYSLRRAERLYVHDTEPRARQLKDELWRTAAFVCGLLHDCGKPFTDMRVVDRYERHPRRDPQVRRWGPHAGALYDWLIDNGIDRYWIRFNANRAHRHVGAGAANMHRFLHRELIEWIESGDEHLLEEMQGALGERAREFVLGRLVMQADADSVSMDVRLTEGNTVALQDRRAENSYLIDTMRSFVTDGRWDVDKPGAVVQVIDGVAYVVWSRGVRDILEQARRDRYPLSRQAPLELAQLLVDSGYAVPCIEGRRFGFLWRIRAGDAGGEALDALRVMKPHLLLGPEAVAAMEAEGGVDHVSGALTEDATGPDRPVVTLDAEGQPPPNPDRDTAGRGVKGQGPASPQAGAGDGPSQRAKPPETGHAGTDRTASRSATTAKSIERPGSAAAQETPCAGDDTLQALAASCRSGELLARIVGDARAGAREAGDLIQVRERRIVLGYPQPLQRYGEPREIFEMLDADGWLEPDPLMRQMKVREIDGRTVLVVPRRHCAAAIAALQGAPDEAAPQLPQRTRRAQRTGKRRARGATGTGEATAAHGRTGPVARNRAARETGTVRAYVGDFIRDCRRGALPDGLIRGERSGRVVVDAIVIAQIARREKLKPYHVRAALAGHPDCTVTDGNEILVRKA